MNLHLACTARPRDILNSKIVVVGKRALRHGIQHLKRALRHGIQHLKRALRHGIQHLQF